LPFPDSDRLIVAWADNPGLKLGISQIPLANADIAAWRERSKTFRRVSAFSPRSADLADGGDAERVGAAGVTAGFFETLGVTPLLGRTLAAEEDLPGGPMVTLISSGLWQRRFGGDPGLLGKSITINGDKRMVIGILPRSLIFREARNGRPTFPFPGEPKFGFR
jgi:putative ABC transport system permease protein